MNRKELSQNHWKYYLMLEKRFVESIEFVELHEDNFDAFSNGYALLIQAIGAELDTVFKEFCNYAIQYPKKVRSLVLIATQYKMPKKLLKFQNLLV